MKLVTRIEWQYKNYSLGSKLAFFIVLYIAATTCFIIFV